MLNINNYRDKLNAMQFGRESHARNSQTCDGYRGNSGDKKVRSNTVLDPLDGSSRFEMVQKRPHASNSITMRSLNKSQGRYSHSFILCVTLIIYLTAAPLVRAGFWTFYLPNFLKPSGYKEMTEKIGNVQEKINVTKDNYADIKYFWSLMKQVDSIDESSLYPEESVCSQLFPMFRDLAIEYSALDYKFYITPMEEYLEVLVKMRNELFPAAEESKAVLPRQAEQELYETEIRIKIKSHSDFTESQKYKDMRKKILDIWKTVRRSLDSSLSCIYLKYAYRQISEDVNQLALEANLGSMRQALDMIESAYKRIEKFKASDEAAMQEIHKEIVKEERFKIRE